MTVEHSVKLARPRYVAELLGSMALYVVLLVSRHYLITLTGNAALQVLIKLSPVIPLCLALLAVRRYYSRIDEYDRKLFLESVSGGFGGAALVSASYSFFADAGLPPLSLEWAWPIMGACWIVARVIQRLRNR